jgi:hypothetical protein
MASLQMACIIKGSACRTLGSVNMSRYTFLFTVAVPLQELHQQVIESLKACSLEIIYDRPDYIMAREVPGRVAFAKLVTAEVLIDRSTATDDEVRMNVVLKNEELPIHVNNHCHQIFEHVHRTMIENTKWRLIDQVVS